MCCVVRLQYRLPHGQRHRPLLITDCIHSQLYLSIMCAYNSIIDLFRKGYQGLKSDFWQLIPRWSSGLVVWFMTSGLGFDSPHNLILKYSKF